MKFINLIFLLYCPIIGLSQNPQEFSWVVSSKTDLTVNSNSIVFDELGNSVIAGHHMGPTDFGPKNQHLNVTSKGYDVFIEKLDSNGNVMWIKTLGGKGSDFCNSMFKDSYGNLYLTGSFSDSVDFDPGVGVNMLYSYYPTLYILKLDDKGDFLWVKSLEGNSQGYDIQVDMGGNIHIVGDYAGIVDFDPGSGQNEVISNGLGSSQIFILKLNELGNFIWVKTLEGSNFSSSFSLAIDDFGSVYIAGTFSGNLIFDALNIVQSAGFNDAFLSKFNIDGQFQWVYRVGDLYYDFGGSVIIDKSNKIIWSGYFTGSVDFDPNMGVNQMTSVGTDFFLQKLDQNSSLIWINTYSENSFNSPLDLYCDHLNNVYSTGLTFTNSNFRKCFIQRHDVNGQKVFDYVIGPAESILPSSIVVDSFNTIYLTGEYTGPCDFDASQKDSILNGANDFFVLKLGWQSNHLSWLDPYYATNMDVVIYPNPTVDFVKIEQEWFIEMAIELFDVSGKLLQKFESKELSVNIDFRDYNSGIYFLKITKEDKVVTSRIFKQF
jgi:arginine repressor